LLFVRAVCIDRFCACY